MRLNDKKKNDLLKEYIRRRVNLLLEYDDPDTGGGAGYWSGSTKQNEDLILTVFGIRPLQNIGRVALGGIEAIATRVFGEAWILVQRLWHIINPYYWAESRESLNALTEQNRAEIANRISRINAGYADVLRDNARIMEHMSGDLNAAMFLANPATSLASSATSESAGALYNVYHRIRYGGPPGVAGSGGGGGGAATGTEASLNASSRNLVARAAAVDSSSGTGRSTAESVARTILGDNASNEDITNLISSSGAPAALTEAGGAVSDSEPTTTSSRAAPTSRAATPRPAAADSSNPAVRQLLTQAQQLNQGYVNFLKSPEARTGLLNSQAVKAGQAELVNMVVDNYRNQVRDLSFERIRSEHPEEFERAEEEARNARDSGTNSESEDTDSSETANSNRPNDTEASESDSETPALFDTEEKRNAFVRYAKQQLAAGPIAQLQTLAQQTPEIATAVNTGISEIQRIAAS